MKTSEKASRSSRKSPPEAVNVKPSAPEEAQEDVLEAQEEAIPADISATRLKQEGSKPVPRGLDPVRDTETARERGRAGGLASAAARRKRKEMREYLEVALRMTDEASGDLNAMVAALALVEKAKAGDVRAWDAILAAVGERPAHQVDVRSGDGSMSPGRQDLTALTFDQLLALTKAEWASDDEALMGGEAGQ